MISTYPVTVLANLTIPGCRNVEFEHGRWSFPCGLSVEDSFSAQAIRSMDLLNRAHGRHHEHMVNKELWYITETSKIDDIMFSETITLGCSCDA